MVKKSLKKYLDKYFENCLATTGSYPMVPYDEEEESALWFGEIDEDEYIQWKYQEKVEQTDFSRLEETFDLTIPDSAKEFYNSYYFMDLEGFYNDKLVTLDSITENRNVLKELTYIFTNESKRYIPIGLYGNMQLPLCIEVDTEKIVVVDYERENITIVADSLEEILECMQPAKV